MLKKCLSKNLLLCSAVLALLCAALGQEVTNSAAAAATPSSTTTTTLAAEPTTGASSASAAATPATAAENSKKYYISDDIPTCQQRDNNLSDCMKQAIALMLPRLKNGSKELNIPPLDPFRLNRTSFQYSSGPVSGRITMRNALVYGFSSAQIKDADFKTSDDNKSKFKLISHVPLVSIVGNYKADVAFNNIKIRPRGTFNVTLTDINIVQLSEGSFYEKDGHRFIRLSKFDVQPEVGGLHVQATGIFPDPTLNEIVLNVVNQYWREIYRIMLPETRKYWGPMLLRVLNETFAAVPYDLLVKSN